MRTMWELERELAARRFTFEEFEAAIAAGEYPEITSFATFTAALQTDRRYRVLFGYLMKDKQQDEWQDAKDTRAVKMGLPGGVMKLGEGLVEGGKREFRSETLYDIEPEARRRAPVYLVLKPSKRGRGFHCDVVLLVFLGTHSLKPATDLEEHERFEFETDVVPGRRGGGRRGPSPLKRLPQPFKLAHYAKLAGALRVGSGVLAKAGFNAEQWARIVEAQQQKQPRE